MVNIYLMTGLLYFCLQMFLSNHPHAVMSLPGLRCLVEPRAREAHTNDLAKDDCTERGDENKSKLNCNMYALFNLAFIGYH